MVHSIGIDYSIIVKDEGRVFLVVYKDGMLVFKQNSICQISLHMVVSILYSVYSSDIV